jgi:hypothetical protein
MNAANGAVDDRQIAYHEAVMLTRGHELKRRGAARQGPYLLLAHDHVGRGKSSAARHRPNTKHRGDFGADRGVSEG